jgi:hypothetical protein
MRSPRLQSSPITTALIKAAVLKANFACAVEHGVELDDTH